MLTRSTGGRSPIRRFKLCQNGLAALIYCLVSDVRRRGSTAARRQRCSGARTARGLDPLGSIGTSGQTIRLRRSSIKAKGRATRVAATTNMIIRAPKLNRHFSWKVGWFSVGLMVLIATAPGLVAQESVQPDGSAAVRVFLDCGYRCDFDYLRTEIPFVNYVRDRLDAQVHVLVTRENTGSGGVAVTLEMR